MAGPKTTMVQTDIFSFLKTTLNLQLTDKAITALATRFKVKSSSLRDLIKMQQDAPYNPN